MPDGMKILCSSTNRIIDKSTMCEYCSPNIYGSLGGPSECECHTREQVYQLFYHTIVWINESATNIDSVRFHLQTWDFSGYDKSEADNFYDEIVSSEGESTNVPPSNSFTLDNSSCSALTKYISLEFERLSWDYNDAISYETYIYKLKHYIRESANDDNHDYKLHGPRKERISYGTARFKKR